MEKIKVLLAEPRHQTVGAHSPYIPVGLGYIATYMLKINASQKGESIKLANNSNNNLKDISNIINDIIEKFNEENKNKMTKEFIMIINNLITMSNQQEDLIENTFGIRSNSPQIRLLNKKQYNLDKELTQITNQLINLSNKTFL